MDKSEERRKKDFYRWPSELPANQCQPSGPGGQIGWHRLAGNLEGNPLADVFFTDSNLFCLIVIRKKGFGFGLFGLG